MRDIVWRFIYRRLLLFTRRKRSVTAATAVSSRRVAYAESLFKVVERHELLAVIGMKQWCPVLLSALESLNFKSQHKGSVARRASTSLCCQDVRYIARTLYTRFPRDLNSQRMSAVALTTIAYDSPRSSRKIWDCRSRLEHGIGVHVLVQKKPAFSNTAFKRMDMSSENGIECVYLYTG